MTIHDFAEMLNGRRYGDEMLPSEIAQARELGFTVVFGYSDDCAEFRGEDQTLYKISKKITSSLVTMPIEII